MTRREAVWCAAYGTAYADAMRRCGHGERVVDATSVSLSLTPIDARMAAHEWATLVADAAAEGSERA